MKNLINFMKENGMNTVMLLLALPLIIGLWAIMIKEIIKMFI